MNVAAPVRALSPALLDLVTRSSKAFLAGEGREQGRGSGRGVEGERWRPEGSGPCARVGKVPAPAPGPRRVTSVVAPARCHRVRRRPGPWVQSCARRPALACLPSVWPCLQTVALKLKALDLYRSPVPIHFEIHFGPNLIFF